MVGVACQDCTGAVELFGEDKAGQVVGQRDWPERELEAGLGVSLCGPTVGGADGEDDVLSALIAAGTEPGGKFGGGKRAASAIEKDWESGQTGGFTGLLGLGKPGEESGFGEEGFGLAWDVGVDSVQVEADEGFVMGFRAGFGGFWTDMG